MVDPAGSIRSNVLLYFGDRGRDWLADLDVRLRHAAERLELQVEPPFSDLSINYVAPATRSDGSKVVLKLGVPNPEIRNEIEALRAFDGRGAVRLLEGDPGRGLLLLERVRPGFPLRGCPEDEATRAAAVVMGRLHRNGTPSNVCFPRIDDWFEAFSRFRFRCNDSSGPLPSLLFNRAESIAKELLDGADRPVLLHGDLHHDNILASREKGWVAIDPKGVMGDPVFEVAPFIRNPMPDLLSGTSLRRTLERRLAILHEHLGYDLDRMRAWVIAESVLSAVWDIDDPDEGWRQSLAVAGSIE